MHASMKGLGLIVVRITPNGHEIVPALRTRA